MKTKDSNSHMNTNCPVCHAPIAAQGSTYCRKCGAALSGATQAVSLTAAQPSGFVLRGTDGVAHPMPTRALLIGRDSGCDIVLADSAVSSRHARLTWQGGQWLLEDLGSSNGSRINGAELLPNRPAVLTVGSQLELGSWRGRLDGSGASPALQPGTTMLPPPVSPSAPAPTAYPQPSPPPAAYPQPNSGGGLPVASSGSSPLDRLGASLKALVVPSSQPRMAGGQPQLPPRSVVVGVVTRAWDDEPMEASRDISKFLVKLSIWLLILGIPALAVWTEPILIFVGAIVLFILLWMARIGGIFLMPLGMFSLFGGKKQEKPDMGDKGFNWSVSDNQSSQIISGRLVRRRRSAGHLTVGDHVAVYGRISRSNQVEAHSIIVVQHAGGQAYARIDGQRPWPWWIGLTALVGALAGLAIWALDLGLLTIV